MQPTLRRATPFASALGQWFATNWRRLASVLTVIVLILLIALLAVPMLVKQLQGDPLPKPSTIPTPVACPAQEVRIEPAIPATAAAGKPITVELAVSTTSALPCLVQAGPGTLGMVITSGQETIINTLVCAGEQPPTKQLLLKAGDSWKGSLSWDGVVRAEGCAPAGESRPGTYVVQLMLGGEKIGGQHVLVLE
ncbi:hypothetical protein [Buchananella felis]|uniref:hypothetical protein n=1 Tax=Buchananella felis TaxID=3231492 RepID=UPI00352746CF